jgi:integrase
MPQVSGVAEPNPKKRLTDSFFVVINDQWIPRVIDDPTFPGRVFEAGEQFEWELRETLIVRMMFETGARISEICGLTVGDWGAKGFSDTSTAFSKGSNGRRVKFLRWSSSTTKLLRKYFDSDRLVADRCGKRLSDYMRSYRSNPDFLYSVPLFLTNRGTTLSANSFRDLYWRPALKAANMHAHIHQARHWYVTMAIREIYEESAERDEVERRTIELIQYMNWRSGKSTLDAYEHYFDRQRHGEIQDKLHRKLDANLKNRDAGVIKKSTPITPPPPDPELDYLLRLGGQLED